MTVLRIFKENEPENVILTTTHANEISEILSEYQVTFEQWPIYDIDLQSIAIENRQTEILKCYEKEVAQSIETGGYLAMDVVSLSSDNANKEALRQKFLDEHTHAEDEVRFFVKGSGLFVFHFADDIFMLQTVAGDFISVPEKAKHWFDMGTLPEFTCIRFFNNPAGWVAEYTGSTISRSFPDYDQLNLR